MDHKMEKLPIMTTNMEIYKNPKHLPGYTGHVPHMKYRHAETFGNSTAHVLSEYRKQKLNDSSQGVRGFGGDAEIPFPSYYNNDSNRVIGTRSRTWERWQASQSYNMFNENQRSEQLRDFNSAAQQHREHYKDHSQTRPEVPFFTPANITHPTTASRS